MTVNPQPHPFTYLKSDTNSGLANPWHIEWRGQLYTVASDGFRMLVVKGHHPSGQPLNPGMASKWTVYMDRHLNTESEHVIGATRARLLEIGEDSEQEVAKGPPVCGRCGEQCPHCRGQAAEARNIQRMTFTGAVFNWDWVQQVLGGLEGDLVSVALLDNALRIEGPDWTYAQMALHYPDPEAAKLFPQLQALI